MATIKKCKILFLTGLISALIIAFSLFIRSEIQKARVFFEIDTTPILIKVPYVTFKMGKSHTVLNFLGKIEYTLRGDFGREILYNVYEPAHKVRLDSFFIAKFETSNGEYLECVLKGPCSYDDVDELKKEPLYPVSNVTWYQARDYCQWRGMRLPTEAEWEAAARGPNNRKYPWGNSIECNYANFSHVSGFNQLASEIKYCAVHPGKKAVGSYARFTGYYGLHDMAGNVSEWVYDWDVDYEKGEYINPRTPPEPGRFEIKVVRGGNYKSPSHRLKTYWRNAGSPEFKKDTVGFRCAADESILEHLQYLSEGDEN